MSTAHTRSRLHRSSERAVSPVIGVVLMVAITIILAAVIGAFVLGLSPNSSDVAPIATITMTGDDGNVTLSHDGGDPLELDEFTLLIDGSPANESFQGHLTSGQHTTVLIDEGDDTVEATLRHDPSGELLARHTIDLE